MLNVGLITEGFVLDHIRPEAVCHYTMTSN